MTRRSRQLRAWPVDKLQELEQLPPVLSSADKCLRCGHKRVWHHRGYRQCRLEPSECHWFLYDPALLQRIKVVPSASADTTV